MAEEEGAERSQDPTEKRKQDAREEGRVLTSREATVFAALAVGTGLALMSASVMPRALQAWRGYFQLGGVDDLPDRTLAALAQAFRDVTLVGLAVALPLALAAVASQALLGGLRFAPKAIGFRFSKLNPLAGFGRMVSATALVEVLKSLAKVICLGAVSLMVLNDHLPELDRLWSVSAGAAASLLGGVLGQLMLALTLVLMGIGALDVLWQWRVMTQQMRMTLQEVKQEAKEQNGSPEVKGRLRQLQMETSRRAARERRALPDVALATAVITNPQHFAVAIRYRAGETRAPVILAMGKGAMAQEIRARAHRHGVVLLPIPLLARALYFTGDIGAEIDEGLFGAVAAVLAHVYRLDRGEAADLPDIDLPADLRFSEAGWREAPPDAPLA